MLAKAPFVLWYFVFAEDKNKLGTYSYQLDLVAIIVLKSFFALNGLYIQSAIALEIYVR